MELTIYLKIRKADKLLMFTGFININYSNPPEAELEPPAYTVIFIYG